MLFAGVDDDLDKMRSLFEIASKDETANEKLMKISDGYTLDYKPVVFAYHAAAELTMANHVTWPGNKLSYFNGGKYKLEAVIKKYSSNIEIRFIRFAVQSGSPSFLGYKSNMTEDEELIRKNISKSNWSVSFQKDVLTLLDNN